ncbi:endonuclease domain-containing protein [Candidatus Gracilibacteria bacterium]|nr:endonuclease domain-containing protein [Candidatus Gracilibacteria bacterium]NUJ98782.1 endonuclease domain-containing protein [Candidatus Gracilibacteria bacterium]
MGKILQNIPALKQTRKVLRKNQTKPEEIFWNKVRNKQFLGWKFRRQHSIGRYIMDFYCKELNLCIEIDGDNHFENEQKEYDEIRTEFLKTAGIKVCRFTNKEIMENSDGVLATLEEIIDKIKLLEDYFDI